MRIHAARGVFDDLDLPEAATGSLAADPDAPIVAFPTPTNAISCQPLDVVWFHSGIFPPNAACDIGITNVGVPQVPWDPPAASTSSSGSSTTSKATPTASAPRVGSAPRRRRRVLRRADAAPTAPPPVASPSPVTITLVHAQPVLSANHSAWLSELRVPTGYYWITGQSVDPASKAAYFHSAQFFVAAGTDTSCLQSLPAVPSTSSSISSSSSLTLLPSPSSPTSLPDNSDQGNSRGSVIAGAVGGGLAVAVLLGTFLLVRYFRNRAQRARPYSNVDAAGPNAGWRTSQAVSHVASPTATVPMSAPVPVSAGLSVPTTASATAAASPDPTNEPLPHAHAGADMLAPGAIATAERKLSSTPSTWTAGTDDSSFADERTQLEQAFVVPVTPNVIADGVMSERSSIGSGVGPMVISPPAHAADAQFVTIPPAPHDLPTPTPPFAAEQRRSRMSTSTGRSSNKSNALTATQVLQMSSRGS